MHAIFTWKWQLVDAALAEMTEATKVIRACVEGEQILAMQEESSHHTSVRDVVLSSDDGSANDDLPDEEQENGICYRCQNNWPAPAGQPNE